MPYRLVDPTPGRSPFYRVRGSEFRVSIDRSTKTAERREAQKILAIWREDAKRASVLGKVKATPTFGSAALAYIQADGEQRFLKPLVEHFGETPLDEIGQAEIDAAAVALYPNATGATRNRQVYSPISALMRHAGVTMALRRPKGSQGKPRTDFLSQAEAFALLDAATARHERFGALLTILLYTGVRLSEALRLEWADVDLKRATALVRETKNGSAVTVHLPPPAVAALASLKDREGRVFRLTKSGRLYNLLADAEKAAGVALPPRSAFHILRHTHATWRRLYTGADTTALVNTGLWKSRNAAANYEHVDATAESRRSDLLPRVKTVRKPRK